ncbi:type II CAAX endopeptidase family protein [Winogradskyella sp. ECml5-4]|uniref:CPBP family intramembrane glutamic endopeptidase n=1 Tax=Winogradskyella sp. ECml5-4 TaxID=3110975 RepID=UPI002FF3CBF9
MTKNIYLNLLIFTTILLVGFYFTSELNNVWVSHFSHLVIMILAGLTLVAFDKGKLPDKEKPEFKINQIIGIIIGIIGLISVCNLIPVLATKMADIDITKHPIIIGLNQMVPILISISIFEEILFRRVLAQKIKNTLGITKGIWISAFVFAIAHIYSDTGILPSFIAGVVFAYIYFKTNSIYLSVVAHLFYNITTYYLLTVFRDRDKLELIYDYPTIALSISFGIILIVGMTKILNKKAGR